MVNFPRGFTPGCCIATPLGLKSRSIERIRQINFTTDLNQILNLKYDKRCDFLVRGFSDSGARSNKGYFLDCNTGSDSSNAKLIRMLPIEQATNCRPFTA